MRSAPRVVAIGGSAGALDALEVVLPALPADAPYGVAVVLHLPEGQPSALPDVFRGRLRLAIEEAEDKTPLLPGRVYFAPPDYHLLVDRGPALALSADVPVLHSRPSIDALLESAAHAVGEGLVAVVLSGASADGAAGLAAVRRAGGIAIVQSPSSAPMPRMPEAAIAAARPDLVLPPAEIAKYLVDVASRPTSATEPA